MEYTWFLDYDTKTIGKPNGNLLIAVENLKLDQYKTQHTLEIDLTQFKSTARFQFSKADVNLYRYYTSSVDMGTNLLGDMVKPCQGHISHSQPQVSGQPPPPTSPSGPPCFSATGTHLSHSGFLGIVYTGGWVREQVPCSLNRANLLTDRVNSTLF